MSYDTISLNVYALPYDAIAKNVSKCCLVFKLLQMTLVPDISGAVFLKWSICTTNDLN